MPYPILNANIFYLHQLNLHLNHLLPLHFVEQNNLPRVEPIALALPDEAEPQYLQVIQ
jgi:hypothetical protein